MDKIGFGIFWILFIALTIIYSFIPINYISLGDPDHTLILNPSEELREYYFTWREYNFGGGYGLIGMGKEITALLFYILSKLMLSEKIRFLIFVFGLLLFGGYGFYKFVLEYVLSNRDKREFFYLAIISGLFYSLNLFSCIITAMDFFLLIPYILTPWIIYYFFKYVTLRRSKYLVIVSFLISLFGIAPNPPTVIISLIIVLWIILTFKYVYGWKFKELVSGGIKVSFLSFLLSFWWILPIIIYGHYFMDQLTKTLHMELFYSGISTFLNVFYLSGYWELFAVYYNMKVFYFSNILWNLRPLLIILSALIVLGAFVYYYLTKNRKEKIILISSFILFIIGLLLAQGYNQTSIIRNIYYYLVTNSPFFGTFRDNYKWVAILAFSYSIFIPYAYLGYKSLLNRISNNQKVAKFLSSIVIILFLLASSFPVWTGTLFNHYFKGIPNELYKVSEFLNKQIKEDYGKIMIMPGAWLPYYQWAYYFTNRPIFLSFISDRSVLVYRYGGESPLSWYGRELVDDMLYKRFFELNISVLKDLGIKYILIDKTLDTRLGLAALPTSDLGRIEEYLESKEFKLIYNNSDYLVYKLPDALSSVIYVPYKVYCIRDNLSTDDKFKLINNLDIRKVAIVTADIDTLCNNAISNNGWNVTNVSDILSLNLTYLIKENDNTILLKYEKINPTLWKVYVNASKPFLLVFAESYDPLWEARVYKDGKLVEKVKAIPVYGVINGFWINQTGNLTVVIRYVPQDWFELGLKISITTFAILLIYLVVPEKYWRKLLEKLKYRLRK